jgi:pimeloyl-ACP methyl ester carboxylesterase
VQDPTVGQVGNLPSGRQVANLPHGPKNEGNQMSQQIRVFNVILLCIPFAPAMAGAAEKPSAKTIAGLWQGPIKVGKGEVDMFFEFTREADQSWSGTWTVLKSFILGDRLDKVTFMDGNVYLERKPVKAVFEGKLSKDGTEIVGQWKQGRMPVPLTLKRCRRPQTPAKPFPYQVEDIIFENKKAHVKLAGTLTLPKSRKPVPAVVFIHGSGPQDRDEHLAGHRPFLLLADYLARRGVAVLRYDKRGIGQSTGRDTNPAFEDFAADALAGLNYLRGRKEIDPARTGLLGHSEGGGIAPLLASRTPHVAFVVIMAGQGITGEEVILTQVEEIMQKSGLDAPTRARGLGLQKKLLAVVLQEKDDMAALKKLKAVLSEELARWAKEGVKDVKATQAHVEAQLPIMIIPAYRTFLAYDPRPALRKVRCPVLTLNGEKDTQVIARKNLPAIARALREGGNKDMTVKSFPGLNHMFQTCQSGLVDEYPLIEETMSPAVLKMVVDWIRQKTGLEK